MNIPEEFGKYLLLKKLTEDPLGETFRAGKSGREGIEQVVLLRVFNGKGMDGEKLWQAVSGRAAVQQALRSPNIGTGVDLGKVRSFPYAAYDYISGKSLATLFAQSEKQLSPIPTDHALLIAERISLALAAAYETKVQDERVQHGFVVPQLVMISNEGETRLLGFEVAPGLRVLAASGWSEAEIQPYVSPETLQGSALARSDDVWSLGALLYELLTGQRLPAAPSEGYGTILDQAMLANEGTPVPPAVVGLLKKSLVPRDQRITDAVTWHKTLSKLMIDGHYSPTTFNLAFFMHNLFRDEIERESQEIQAEKRLDLPKKPAAAPAAALAAVADMREKTGVRETTLPGTRVAAAQAAPSSKMPLFIGVAAALLVAAGVGAWLVYGRPAGKSATGAAAPTPAPTTTAQPAAIPLNQQTAVPAPAVPAGPSQEEIKAQIQSMVEAQGKALEDKYKAQYDDRIKQLQKQLEDRQRQEEAARIPAPAPQLQEPTPAPVERAAVKPPEPTPAQSSSVQTQPAAPPVNPERERTTPAPQQQTQTNTAPPVQAPSRPQIQYGDLVPVGAVGVTPPKIRVPLDPRYPAAAKRLNKSATVDIKVLVDETGRVLQAERTGPKAGFGFDEAALDAARRASFQPAATRDGVRVKMWWTVRVTFKP